MTRTAGRIARDRRAGRALFLITGGASLLVPAIAAGLYLRSRPVLAGNSLTSLLFSSSWRPLRGEFGFFPFIAGTLWVTATAVVIAVPLCVLAAVYLAEYSPARLREGVKPLIDLLAGIPSVIFGIWGVLVVVPLVQDRLAPLFGVSSSGYCVLAGGVVLAIMIFPVIIHVCLEVFGTVPAGLREASLALGATRWETIRYVTGRRAFPGLIAAVVLGLSRAFGETMAVLMVAGNVARVPSSLFDPAYPLPALIANNYGEMLSIPLYDSALLFSALLLLAVVVFFNVISRVILVRVERRIA
jgi:phosphate transport system permease protein